MNTYEATLKKITVPNVSSKDTVQLNIPADCYFYILAAVGKQIEKKPGIVQVENYAYPSFRCSCCDTFVSSLDNYCRECGQALDWSEVNESNPL